MRERWPKARRSSTPNQRWLRSSSGRFFFVIGGPPIPLCVVRDPTDAEPPRQRRSRGHATVRAQPALSARVAVLAGALRDGVEGHGRGQRLRIDDAVQQRRLARGQGALEGG